MQVDRFKQSSVGRLTPISGEDRGRRYSHYAFVPAPLPESVQLSAATYKLVSEADLAIGEMKANLRQLPNPRLLIRPALTKEAVATSALEGTYAPLADVLEADYVDERRSSPEVREVRNYITAATRGIELIKVKPICLTLIADLQGVLVKGTRGDTYDAGQLRKRQVCIGPQGRPVEESRFVPPPPEHLEEGVSDWEKWINADHEMPLLVKMALAHYQFETLHPFADGNGRLGRLIIALQLMTHGVLEYPVLNISPWLEPRRPDYQDHLLRVSQTGDFDPWVAFFAEGMRDRALAASNAILALLQVKDEFLERLREVNASGAITQLAADLIGFPMLDVGDAQKMLEVTYPAANTIVGRLVKLGILRQVSEGNYRRVFACDAVYRVIAES